MAEFTEVIRQFQRMCNDDCKIDSVVDCTDCPFLSKRTVSCLDYIIQNSKEAEEIIMDWAKEHPVKTNADKFKEVFGHDIRKSLRRCDVFDCNIGGCEHCEHKDFWDREYKGD